MGNIWSNLVIIFGRSTFHPGERAERYYNEESLTQTLEKRLQEIKDLLWDMAREGNWEKTYLDVETKKITSKKLTKEDFNNIKYSALNVNQNTKCPFIMQKTTPNEKDQHCWRMATLTSSFDYETAPISSSNPFLILKNPRIRHPFAVEEDKWILIEEAKRFQKILKENMNHPVSPAKEFWRKEYEKNMQDYNLSFEELKVLYHKIEVVFNFFRWVTIH